MPYKNIIFVKLEKRLFNDHRWYMMSESGQLNYVRFMLFAAETYNKIPKNLDAIKLAFKTKQDVTEIQRTIDEIKLNFPKFKESKHFYHFDGFETKTNYRKERTPGVFPRKSQGLPKEVIDKEKDKEKDKDKEGRVFTPPTLEEIKSYCLERKNQIIPDRFKDFYDSKGWMIGKNKMKDWRASVRTWEQNEPKVKDNEPKRGDLEYQRTKEYLKSLENESH